MGRYQSGHIYEASGAFFVRYYVSEIVDGRPTRVQRSYRLCSKDDKHHSRTCKAVKQKSAEHMETVNANAAPVNDQTVATFWEKTYLPFAEENLRASTVHGYKQIWGQHLCDALRNGGAERLQDASWQCVPHVACEEAREGDDSAHPVTCVGHLQPRSQRRCHRVQPVARCQGTRARPRNPAKRRITRSKKLRTSSVHWSITSIAS